MSNKRSTANRVIFHLEVVAEDEAVQDLQAGIFHKLGW